MTKINFETAKKIALKKLDVLATSLKHPLSINERNARTLDIGWVFFYNSKRYLETGERSWALGGNAPIFVSSEAQLFELRTDKPWKETLADLCGEWRLERDDLNGDVDLPVNSTCFGEFGYSYRGTETIIHFEYEEEGKVKIGGLRFANCTFFCAKNTISQPSALPFDRVSAREGPLGVGDPFKKYELVLSNGDFEFEIVAKDCTFFPDVQNSDLVDRD
jgi:hypothetical protein